MIFHNTKYVINSPVTKVVTESWTTYNQLADQVVFDESVAMTTHSTRYLT